MLSRIRLSNFKCHENLQFTLKAANILVGPNNAGKSSVIDSIRVIDGAGGALRSRRPSNLRGPQGRMLYGYEIPIGSIPVNLDHAVFNYDDEPATIEYQFSGNRNLRAIIQPRSPVIIEILEPGRIRTVNDFLRAYDVSLSVIPPLGPLEQAENYLQDRTVQDGIGTRLASRHFRNYWLRQPREDFLVFKELVESSWPGIELNRPEAFGYGDDRGVRMFFSEDRTLREVAWSGIGFQVWLQILTNVLRFPEASIVVIDEPDIYLHPDMQKRLLDILRVRFAQFLIATHSPEIINEAQINEICSIEKGRRHVKRVSDLPGLQSALNSIGSNDNIELTKLSRARRITFFEGKDRKLLKAFAKKLGLAAIERDTDTLFLELGGFSRSHRIEAVSWTFSEILGQDVGLFAVFDRDFRCDEEVQQFVDGVRETGATCFVWGRKELENYLLVPSAIQRALEAKMRAADDPRPAPTIAEIVLRLREEAEAFRHHVFSQVASFRRAFLREHLRDRRAEATIDLETMRNLEEKWATIEGVATTGPGKELFSALNRRLQQDYGRALTPGEVIRALELDEIDESMNEVLAALNAFCD